QGTVTIGEPSRLRANEEAAAEIEPENNDSNDQPDIDKDKAAAERNDEAALQQQQPQSSRSLNLRGENERYIFLRADSVSLGFFLLFKKSLCLGNTIECLEFSSNLLYDLSRSIGKSDSRNFRNLIGLDTTF